MGVPKDDTPFQCPERRCDFVLYVTIPEGLHASLSQGYDKDDYEIYHDEYGNHRLTVRTRFNTRVLIDEDI